MPDLSVVQVRAGSFAIGSGPPSGTPAVLPFGYFDKDARQFYVRPVASAVWRQVGAPGPTATLHIAPPFGSLATLHAGNAAPGVTITGAPNVLAVTNARSTPAHLKVWSLCSFGRTSAFGGVNITEYRAAFDPGSGTFVPAVEWRASVTPSGGSERSGSFPSWVDFTHLLPSTILAPGASITFRAQASMTQVSTVFTNWGGSSTSGNVQLRCFAVG